jgi:hypothetical protein
MPLPAVKMVDMHVMGVIILALFLFTISRPVSLFTGYPAVYDD